MRSAFFMCVDNWRMQPTYRAPRFSPKTVGLMAAVVTVVAGLRPRVLARVDWGLLLVFVLMFVDLRLVAARDAGRNYITIASEFLGQDA